MEGHQAGQPWGTGLTSRGGKSWDGLSGARGDLTAAVWGQMQRSQTQTLLRVPDNVTGDKDHEFRVDIRKSSFSKGRCSPGTGGW